MRTAPFAFRGNMHPLPGVAQVTLNGVESRASTQTPEHERAFFSWRARDGQGRRGAGGVTDRDARAVELLTAALRRFSAGATGSVRIVILDKQAKAPAYRQGRVLVRAERDASGGIVFDEGEPVTTPGLSTQGEGQAGRAVSRNTPLLVRGRPSNPMAYGPERRPQ